MRCTRQRSTGAAPPRRPARPPARAGTRDRPVHPPVRPSAHRPSRYSNWPTIPQAYVNGEFIGGCDLLIEMYQNGELQEMVEVAAAE